MVGFMVDRKLVHSPIIAKLPRPLVYIPLRNLIFAEFLLKSSYSELSECLDMKGRYIICIKNIKYQSNLPMMRYSHFKSKFTGLYEILSGLGGINFRRSMIVTEQNQQNNRNE